MPDTGIAPFALADKFTRRSGTVPITGIQALVRMLLDQQRADARRGLSTAGLVSGYPGSPIGGFDIELGRQHALLEAHHIRHLPGLNEDLAATAAVRHPDAARRRRRQA